MSRYKKILGSDHRSNVLKNEVTKNEVTKNKNEVTKIKRMNESHTPHFYDPRPDLDKNYGDSVRWTILLELAHDVDPELYGRLHGFRCQGTTLKKSAKWGYILIPAIDPQGNTAWCSQKEYDGEKRKWLDPYRNELIALLGKIQKFKSLKV